MNKLRKFLAANVFGLVALFFALGGTAFAAKTLITGSDIAPATITGTNVAADTLTGGNVNESTLGKVPSAGNADQLGGKAATSYLGDYQLVLSPVIHIAPNQWGSPIASCPPGKRPLGGGYDGDNFLVVHGSTPWFSAPEVPAGWQARVENPSSYTGQIYAYAICAAAP